MGTQVPPKELESHGFRRAGSGRYEEIDSAILVIGDALEKSREGYERIRIGL